MRMVPPNHKPGNAKRIREIRKLLGWTQKKFADAAGVSTNTVTRWEIGLQTCPLMAERLAEFLLKEHKKRGGLS